MMNIAIFQDITTENALRQLEEDGLKYAGLYVDMDNDDERRYIKDNAALIAGLLKKLDRARIDKSREYKNSVDAEAGYIISRLEEANKPFTLLLDEHKAKRAKILADEKAIEDAKALVIQIEQDHEQAILEDKVATFEATERVRLKAEHEAELVRAAVASSEKKAVADQEAAVQRERDRVAREQQGIKDDQERRERNTEHKKTINNAALSALAEHAWLTEEQAKLVVKAIAYGRVPAVTINY